MALSAGRAIAYAALFGSASAFSCLDESGKETDYFAVLKENDGANTYYHDADTGSGFTKSAHGLSTSDSNQGAVMATLHQLYGNLGSSHAYALYNDQTPTGHDTSVRAHSKGVILFNGEKGFWLIHSFPNWPGGPEQGYQGLPTVTYGQSFFCVSFRVSELEKIASIQMMHWPQVYEKKMTSDLESSLPTFSAWISDTKSTTEHMSTSLRSYNGRTFTHYGKNGPSDVDLYSGLVATGIQSNLRVETWQNGKESLKMPAFCKPDYQYTVENVTNVQMSDKSWRETQDHSKWAVSDSSAKVVCIGDLNRQYSQEKRGGGTLCYHNSDLWSAFNSAIETTIPCGAAAADAAETADGAFQDVVV